MIFVKPGDRVRLRNKRIVDVEQAPTNTADPALEGEFDTSLPAETIFIGRDIENGRKVVTDMSEVVLVVDKSTLV